MLYKEGIPKIPENVVSIFLHPTVMMQNLQK
jgi:hypothetical protein